jgi:hypothetical protein
VISVKAAGSGEDWVTPVQGGCSDRDSKKIPQRGSHKVCSVDENLLHGTDQSLLFKKGEKGNATG